MKKHLSVFKYIRFTINCKDFIAKKQDQTFYLIFDDDLPM